jgi:hypothetical protein
MNIDDMPAGLEIDAIVADKVFGFRRWEGIPDAFHPKAIRWWQTEQPCDPPPYSTDIAAAWNVFEKIERQPGFVFNRFIEKKDKSYVVSFDGINYSEAEDAPLAICHAALKAFELIGLDVDVIG